MRSLLLALLAVGACAQSTTLINQPVDVSVTDSVADAPADVAVDAVAVVDARADVSHDATLFDAAADVIAPGDAGDAGDAGDEGATCFPDCVAGYHCVDGACLATGDASAHVDAADATMVPSCFTQDGTAPLCPSARVAQPDATHQNYRVTQIRITAPASLASPILGNVINGAMHSGGFLWGISFNTLFNVVRTGALNVAFTRGSVGQGLIDGTFQYYAGDAPAAGGPVNRWNSLGGPITTTAGRVSSMALMGTVRLPIFDASGAYLLELPLTNASITGVALPTDGGCIGLGQISGGRFNECSSNWATSDGTAPYGTLSAVITIADARATPIPSLMTTLCNLLAGADCETAPHAMWMRQPDAMVGTPPEPGYTLTAEFAAISARMP